MTTIRTSGLSVRAKACLMRITYGHWDFPSVLDSPLETILGVKSFYIHKLGFGTFCEITHELIKAGIAVDTVHGSKWWQSAPQKWREDCQLKVFYIRNTNPTSVGNCARWWCVDGAGYTCDLKKAWRVSEEQAKSICRDRPEQDQAYPCEVVDRLAVLHVDVQGLSEGVSL